MSWSGRNVLITGGLGFLGSNLAHALLEKGARITCVDALLPDYGGNEHNVSTIRERIEVQYADIRDRFAMNQLVKGRDVIFHIAAQSSHLDSMVDPYFDVDVNLNGTLSLLEAVRRHNRSAYLIYAGSRAQYGKIHSARVAETDLPNPMDIYGVNKLAAEYYIHLYARVHGFQATSLRLTNIYGPRHQMKNAKYGILNWFVRLALDDQTISVFGDGSQLRDYLYVEDAVQAFLLAAERAPGSDPILNVGGNEPVKFADMTRLIVEIAGRGRIQFVEWPKDRKDIETGDFATDSTRIRNALGWRPTVSLDDGIRRTIEFYRKNKTNYW